MRKIAERFRPFTHKAGASFPIPGASSGVQIYPAAVRIIDTNEWISVPITPPVKDFTAILDLEKGGVCVLGKAASGFFRYWIWGHEGTIHIDKPSFPKRHLERLSFGVTKKGDWEGIYQRKLPTEIFPYWFMLGQYFPEEPITFTFNDLMPVFETGFESVFYPSEKDPKLWGYPSTLKPSYYAGYKLIRDQIVKCKGDTCIIRPLFTAGKLQSVQLPFGVMDLEWTKGQIRTIHLKSQSQGIWKFNFPSELKSCRCNYAATLNLQEYTSLDLLPDTEYVFDQFIK